ncbi:hypothetical protein ACFYOT_16310 [Saccharothrix saharensis]|uniref:hypothetical protein n=1 Tax=Saccharothrix saharensis TaxID=571190 RepID=UPI003677D75B
MAGNPLQPFTGVVRFLWSVAAVGLLLALWHEIRSTAGDVCFSSAVVAGSFGAEYQGQGALRAGASTHPSELRYCLAEPTAGDRALGVFDGAPSWFAYAALFFLLMRLLERASEEGIHTAATADRVRRLGWFTLLVLPGVTLVEAVVRLYLLRHAVTFDVSLVEFMFDWSVPWWAVVTGVGLGSLAKIMRTSADMRADLEGTV